MVQHINITPLHFVGESERGTTYDFKLRLSDEFILMKRYAGTLNGNTYHTGISDKTNPKTFILIDGCIELSYRHIEEKLYHTVIIDTPSIIEIYANVTHAMQALTDITVLECNGFKDIENDRYRLNVIPE